MLHATMPFPWSASSVLFEFDTTMHKSGITVFTKGSSIMFNEEKEKKIGKGFHFDSKQEEAFEQAGKFLFSRIYLLLHEIFPEKTFFDSRFKSRQKGIKICHLNEVFAFSVYALRKMFKKGKMVENETKERKIFNEGWRKQPEKSAF